MPEVSVVIPVFDAARYLRACLGSVVGQTLRDIEVICVDDGSADGSAGILREFAESDSRVKVLSQPNMGQGAARNRGLEAATGGYVHFMDADDELASPDALERLVREAVRDRLDALFFDAEVSVDAGIETSAVKASDYIRTGSYPDVASGRELFSLFLKSREYSVSPCLVLLRRAFLAENGVKFPSERIFHEDNVFMTRVMLSARRAGHRPWRLYVRKVHEGSVVTSRPTVRHLRGYLACYLDACEVIGRGGWDRHTRAALVELRVVYKLHVRRIADAHPGLVAEAEREMPPEERAALRAALEYPLREAVVNAFRCLRERGLAYTLRRIAFGRQPD